MNPDGTNQRVLATGPNRDIGLAGELSWVGKTGLLMTNERISGHSYMTFDTAKAPFNRTVSDGNDAAFTRSLAIPGGMGGDGLAVSRDDSTAMWMIRTSHNPSSWVLTVRSAAVAALSGQSANGFGNVLLTEGRDFNRGFSMSPDSNFFVISLKSGEGYDLFLRDIGTGETISRLTTTGETTGIHNLHPDFSPDGQWVAFAAQPDANGRGDLYITGVNGIGLRQITDTPDTSEGRPSWSPDGTDRFTRVKPEPTQDELAKDYDNAVPRYIGRSLKDSTNPSDFTWEPNPERKPWTSYAQGLNGEGFSLMPYGENLLTGTSSELSTDKTLSFIIKYGWSKAVKFVDKKITLQAYIENAPYDLRVQFWNNSRPLFGNIVPKGTSGISSVTGTVPSSATDGNITMAFVNQGTLTEPAVLPYSKLKLELANTMNIPTPWTPAPSEDPLGAIPKYVGTAALPYDDWTKYTYTMNPE